MDPLLVPEADLPMVFSAILGLIDRAEIAIRNRGVAIPLLDEQVLMDLGDARALFDSVLQLSGTTPEATMAARQIAGVAVKAGVLALNNSPPTDTAAIIPAAATL